MEFLLVVNPQHIIVVKKLFGRMVCVKILLLFNKIVRMLLNCMCCRLKRIVNLLALLVFHREIMAQTYGTG